jgi:hypothetical protein
MLTGNGRHAAEKILIAIFDFGDQKSHGSRIYFFKS